MNKKEKVMHSFIDTITVEEKVLVEFVNSFPCGICEKKDAGEALWFSPVSQIAHSKCVKQIAQAEEQMSYVIRGCFRDFNANMAHWHAIKNIKNHLDGKTILAYLNENGPDKLKEVFDKYSKEAIFKYVQDMDDKKRLEARCYKMFYPNSKAFDVFL